jgi:FkbM family methyltransferase
MNKLIKYIPKNRYLYDLCQAYLNSYKNENNSDMSTNGELCFLRKILPSCDVVFDVGANVGDWSNAVISLNARCSLYSFEPSLTTFNKLQLNVSSDKAVLKNIGLGSVKEKSLLYVNQNRDTLSSLFRREGLNLPDSLNSLSTEVVSIERLDEFCRHQDIPSIDLLKMDVEGYEMEVLVGSGKFLSEKKINVIQFEYGGANIDAKVLLKDLLGLLISSGYKIYKVHANYIEHIESYNQALENFQYKNFIAVSDNFHLPKSLLV